MNPLLRNILLGLSLAAPLGPSSVAVIQNGLRGGFLRAILTGIGVTLADTTYLLIVFFGLSGFMGIPAVKIGVWAFGALVLFYLGAGSLREGLRPIDFERFQNGNPKQAATHPLLAGYLINLSNPIAVVWWVGIYGSLLGTATGEGTDRLGVLLSSASILAGIFLWHTTTSLLSHWGKRFLIPQTARMISILAGLALILFGARFAWNAIQTMSSLL